MYWSSFHRKIPLQLQVNEFEKKHHRKFHAVLTQYNRISFVLETCKFVKTFISLSLMSPFMYRSNQSFNMPPLGNPPGIWLFWKLLFKLPPTQAKIPFKCPTLGSIQVIKCPHTPGKFHRHNNDRRTAETPSVVEQNIYKYNKNWETLLAYLLRTKVLCKEAEIAATRSLNAQLFFVIQHIKCSIKKPFHWHASSFTLLINILVVGQSSWPELFILFYVVVLNRR